MFCILFGSLYLLHNYACKLLVQMYLVEMLIISSAVRLGFVELYDNPAPDSMQFSFFYVELNTLEQYPEQNLNFPIYLLFSTVFHPVLPQVL